METANNVQKNKIEAACHDCEKKIIFKDNEIKNGFELVYDNNGEKIKVFKCSDCFSRNQGLRNFQKCEVYSRVVGYIRPVSQWHKGKKQEYGERKEYGLNC